MLKTKRLNSSFIFVNELLIVINFMLKHIIQIIIIVRQAQQIAREVICSDTIAQD
jgi:hypothetical protein